jgi:hypothetical protein
MRRNELKIWLAAVDAYWAKYPDFSISLVRKKRTFLSNFTQHIIKSTGTTTRQALIVRNQSLNSGYIWLNVHFQAVFRIRNRIHFRRIRMILRAPPLIPPPLLVRIQVVVQTVLTWL